ncbi:MAG: hypothetical protein C0625_11200 [Arcobacter sp.]|nr:MAG: hypothetical protein C0625_11200 [Arcobacter sp.]
MNINHIFIFCDNHDEVANELIEFGFFEGSNRIHANQGTRNRKFYFNDFYIEIIWVHSIEEATNKITKPTKLYERSKYKTNGSSPFGLCVNYSSKDDVLFENCLNYKPTYLPENMIIEVLTNENSVTLPWTFRWKSDIVIPPPIEPINFSKQKLSKVIFGIKKNEIQNEYLNLFISDEIFFEDTKNEFLKLFFDSKNDKKNHAFNSIPLILEY